MLRLVVVLIMVGFWLFSFSIIGVRCLVVVCIIILVMVVLLVKKMKF